MFCDRSRDGLGILLNRFIRESNHDPAMLIEVSFTFQVRLLDDVVVATIDLDNQSLLNTREILFNAKQAASVVMRLMGLDHSLGLIKSC